MQVEPKAEYIRVELKYCERCGGLMFRPANTARVYCGACELDMLATAVPKSRRRGGQTKPGVDFLPTTQTELLAGGVA